MGARPCTSPNLSREQRGVTQMSPRMRGKYHDNVSSYSDRRSQKRVRAPTARIGHDSAPARTSVASTALLQDFSHPPDAIVADGGLTNLVVHRVVQREQVFCVCFCFVCCFDKHVGMSA